MLTAKEYKKAEFDLTVADERRGFKVHACVYVVVNAVLIALNALLWVFTNADFPWAIFPLVCWGIGLTFHYFDAIRHEGRSIRAHQDEVEAYAERTKELV